MPKPVEDGTAPPIFKKQKRTRGSKRYSLAALIFIAYFTVVALTLIIVAAMGEDIFSLSYWGSLEDRSAVLRNLGLVAIGVIGLPFGIWRAITAYRQVQTANEQARIANKQMEIAGKGLIIDRFQKGAALLHSKELPMRLAGIYALRELAVSDPDETYIIVQDLLCDLVRENSKKRIRTSIEGQRESFQPFTPDLYKALETISWLRNQVWDAAGREQRANWRVDLREANLHGASLREINLSSADLDQANLSEATLKAVNLSSANLSYAVLSSANPNYTAFSSAKFEDTDLSGAQVAFTNITGTGMVRTNLSNTLFFSQIYDEIIWGNEAPRRTIWAWRDEPPKHAPLTITDNLAIREPNEVWNTFVKRIMQEEPELGWTENDLD